MDKWEFLQRHDGAWYWQHTSASGAMRVSTVCFKCEADCVGNAIYHGYLACCPDTARPRHALSMSL